MANALGSKSAATAERLLQKFGGLGVYTFETTAAWDGVTQPPPTPTPTNIDITTYLDKASLGEIQSGLVLATESIFLVSAKELGVEPKAGHKIVYNTLNYLVSKDLPIYGGQDVSLHRLVCSIA